MVLHRGGGPGGRVAEVAPLRPGWPAFAGNNPIGKTLRLRTALERFTTRRVVVVSLVGFAACVAGLAWRQLRLGGFALLDSRGWYTPEEAAALFDALDRLDANARAIYAATGLTIDMAFPIAYGVLFATLLFHGDLFQIGHEVQGVLLVERGGAWHRVQSKPAWTPPTGSYPSPAWTDPGTESTTR